MHEFMNNRKHITLLLCTKLKSQLEDQNSYKTHMHILLELLFIISIVGGNPGCTAAAAAAAAQGSVGCPDALPSPW